MELFKPVSITRWGLIRERYQNYFPDIVDERLISFQTDVTEITWLDEHIGTEVVDLVGKKVKIKNAILFGQGPFNEQGTHVDGHFNGREGARNWALNIPVLNCDQGEMIWFSGDYILQPAVNPSNIRYQHITWNDGPHALVSKIIDTPTIVKVNVPHRVINHSDQRRLMLSVRFSPDLY